MGASGFLSVSAPPRGEGGGGVVDEKDFAPPNAPPFQAHAPWSAMFPQPFAAGVASLRGGWGLVSAIFTYTNTYSGFPAVGCGGLGQQVPRAPQSLRVGVGGRGPKKQKPTPPPCPKKTNFW